MRTTYRNQFAPWQQKKQVFQVIPMDLSTINSMVIVTGSKPGRASQGMVEAYATERVNMALWLMMHGGIK
jgi:hypothetical protein